MRRALGWMLLALAAPLIGLLLSVPKPTPTLPDMSGNFKPLTRPDSPRMARLAQPVETATLPPAA